eukprot:11921778-Ditylum_brightwellii.AAC.1
MLFPGACVEAAKCVIWYPRGSGPVLTHPNGNGGHLQTCDAHPNAQGSTKGLVQHHSPHV